jgi:hypothetical protein
VELTSAQQDTAVWTATGVACIAAIIAVVLVFWFYRMVERSRRVANLAEVLSALLGLVAFIAVFFLRLAIQNWLLGPKTVATVSGTGMVLHFRHWVDPGPIHMFLPVVIAVGTWFVVRASLRRSAGT